MLKAHPTLARTCSSLFLPLSRGQGGVGRCRAAAILVPPPALLLPRWSRGTGPQTDSGETLVERICIVGGLTR